MLLFTRVTLYAQTDSLSKYYDMSLEQLRNVKSSGVSSELEKFINSLITVASKKGISTRESPSIISLISEDEIKNSGARDLIDVLRLVPGFDLAYDGSNSIGIGVRGNWANEGKVLLQIDGVQINEIFSGTTQFGNNFPVSSISRIEIIRGPGSAIYGGFAELGVINIITKSANELSGAYVTGTYGQMNNSMARRTLNVGIGKKMNDLEISMTGVIGEGNRSDRDAFVKDLSFNTPSTTGDFRSLANNSSTNPFLWNARIGYRGLSVRLIYDNYETDVLTISDSFGKHFLSKYSNSLSGEVKYDWRVSRKLEISPSFFFTRQSPYTDNLPDTITLIQEKGQRFKSSITVNYSPSRRVNIITGFDYFTDIGSNDVDSITTVNGYVRSIRYDNFAIFGQLTARHRIVNTVLGARYEYNSKFGDAFVPRIAFTKRMDRLHFKMLYSGSFRSPTIQNIARGADFVGLDAGIKPERATVVEMETGFQLTRDIITTLNLYNSEIKDPIIYLSDLNIYTNLDRSGSRGVEFEARMKKRWGFVNANYSYYTVAHQERLQAYSTNRYAPGDTLEATGGEANKNVLLAFPAHKVTLNANISISKSISFSPSFIFVSERYGYDFRSSGSNTYEIYLRRDGHKLTSNLFFNWLTPLKGLEMGAGIYNVFNSRYDYLVPVASRSAAPLPSTSREYSLRLSYALKSK